MKYIEKEKTFNLDKYIRILTILSKIPEDKLERIVSFLEKLDFDEDDISGKRDTLIYDRDLIFKIMGDVDIKSSEEIFLTSNHTKVNPKTGQNFSIRLNDKNSEPIGDE